jgi:nucleotide-binding universal stress UspA family protein
MYTHLLLVTDRTPYSDKVIADGIRFAKAIGAKVTIFTAISPWIGPEFSLVVRSDDTVMRELLQIMWKDVSPAEARVRNRPAYPAPPSRRRVKSPGKQLLRPPLLNGAI